MIKIHKSNCVTVDYRKLTTLQFKANCVTIDQHPTPPCWVLERIDVVNQTRPFSQGRLSSLIDKALREKGSGHARLALSNVSSGSICSFIDSVASNKPTTILSRTISFRSSPYPQCSTRQCKSVINESTLSPSFCRL